MYKQKMRMIGSHDGATEPNKVFFQRSSLATPSCRNRWKIHFTLAEMLNYKIIYESFICVIVMTSYGRSKNWVFSTDSKWGFIYNKARLLFIYQKVKIDYESVGYYFDVITMTHINDSYIIL